MRLLIVDDDPNYAFLLGRILAHAFPMAEILNAPDGEAALHIYRQHGADLVITDHVMPYMDGPTLIRALLTMRASMPIIALSSSPFAQPDALAAGATLFFEKSAALTRIVPVIAGLIAEPVTC